MARPKKKSIPGLSPDPIVSRLVRNPETVPELITAAGWLGPSTKANQWRLYLTPNLDRYLEIPEKAIVHFERVRDEANDSTGTILWLEPNPKIRLQISESLAAGPGWPEEQLVAAHLGEPMATIDPIPLTRYKCWMGTMIGSLFPKSWAPWTCDTPGPYSPWRRR